MTKSQGMTSVVCHSVATVRCRTGVGFRWYTAQAALESLGKALSAKGPLRGDEENGDAYTGIHRFDPDSMVAARSRAGGRSAR